MIKISKVMVAAGCAAGLWSVAQAQQFDRTWTPVTTGQGCIFYEQRYIVEMNAADQWTYTWSGACTPGAPISGVGTLNGLHPTGARNDITGRFVKGYKDGPIKFVRTAGALAPDPSASSVITVRYNMGCGAFNRPDECRPARR